MFYAPDLTRSLKTSCNIILQTEERRKEIVWALHSDYTKEIDACLWRMNAIFSSFFLSFFIYLFGVLRRFQHCTGHITTGSWKGRGNQYIQFVRVLYCKLSTTGKQLPALPLQAVTGIEPRPQRWEARVLPLCHRGPLISQQVTFSNPSWYSI